MSAEKNSYCGNLENNTERQVCCKEKEKRQVIHDRYFKIWFEVLKLSNILNGFALIAVLALWGAHSDKNVGFEIVAVLHIRYQHL